MTLTHQLTDVERSVVGLEFALRMFRKYPEPNDHEVRRVEGGFAVFTSGEKIMPHMKYEKYPPGTREKVKNEAVDKRP